MMRRAVQGTNIADFDAVRLAIASPADILDWSHGEVTKPETINYRTQKPERDGLFCEKIFGPTKDMNPHDAKFKGIRARDMAVDKNGEVVTKSIVRRERMGHISLAAPVAHIWFLRGTPSAIGLVLNMTVKNLERITYFASYAILEVDTEKRDQMLADKEATFSAAQAAIKLRYEDEASKPDANVKALAEMQSKEIDDLTIQFEQEKAQLESLVKHALINETDYRNLPEDMQDIITVGMGGSAIEAMLKEVNLSQLISDLAEEAEGAKGQRRKKVMKRLRMLESMEKAGIKPSSMCLSVLPVIPPDLRPMVQLTGGRFATSDLNDLYRRVINRNNRLKKLIDLNAPEVIRRNEQRMLQEAVDSLIDNNASRSGKAVSTTGQRRKLKSLSDMLKGKQGRFRQNLLGKRVDYSGRSVIVAGPELSIDQCGLPKMMALELFKPFVIGYLIEQDYAHNIKSATRLIEQGETMVWDALDEVIKGKYVLLNRAPSLHRLSVLAFRPKLIEGKAIQLHPLACKGFNADFDGDQMAVHLPLSDEAQAEARELMTATRNLLKPADGEPVLNFSQDMVLGLYYLTYDKPAAQTERKFVYGTIAEAEFAYEHGIIMLQTPILIDLPLHGRIQTTLGRVLFNELLPGDFPYQNQPLAKKQLDKVLAMIFARFGAEEAARIADNIKDLGFSVGTNSGLTTSMDDYATIPGIAEVISEGEQKVEQIYEQYEQGFITNEERYKLTVEAWIDVDNRVSKLIGEHLSVQDNGVSLAAISGARGSTGQIKNVTGMIGVVVDTLGRAIELPVRSNFKSGLTPLEYFTKTRGSRKGLIDTALRTADSGYLTRRLVDVAQDVFTTDENIIDPGFTIYRVDAELTGVPISKRLSGRFAAEDVDGFVKKGELITAEIASKIEESNIPAVKIMSALSTPAVRGVPQKSYGIDPATGSIVAPWHPAGVIAAQSIGEPGTQLTLNTKHQSGAAAAQDVTQGLPRVDELFEARNPKGQAYLSEISGTVRVWEEGEHYVVQVTASEEDQIELMLEGRTSHIKSGTDVSVGEVLASFADNAKPLVATVSGRADVTEDSILITPKEAASIRYEIPGYKQLLVSEGDRIEKGGMITAGSINLHELLSLKGVEATQRYIMNEIASIYSSQGHFIGGIHLEIIVRQMFSRVTIEESGDSEFVTGDIVSKAAVIDENAKLVTEGRQPASYTQMLLGITKVSVWADSFLSAASFQDTTRVLISAATSGKVDQLYGLKENVILGRKIPVGTGRTDKISDEAESFDEEA
jgi:DNA-directed RNA polymerase subunit beta'